MFSRATLRLTRVATPSVVTAALRAGGGSVRRVHVRSALLNSGSAAQLRKPSSAGALPSSYCSGALRSTALWRSGARRWYSEVAAGSDEAAAVLLGRAASELTLGVPKEVSKGEKRVAATPETVAKYVWRFYCVFIALVESFLLCFVLRKKKPKKPITSSCDERWNE